MITVEELIIQSLYHKLVLVNVKRTAAPTPTGGKVDALGKDKSGDRARTGSWVKLAKIMALCGRTSVYGQSQYKGHMKRQIFWLGSGVYF